MSTAYRGRVPRLLGGPRSAELSPGAAAVLVIAFALLSVALLVTAGNAVLGIGGRAAAKPIRDWVSSGMYILVAAIVVMRAIHTRVRRRPWAVFALGLSLYAIGNVLWSLWIEHLEHVPIPSVCDGLWLTLYPLCYWGIVGLARPDGQRRVPAGVWLDGIIAGAGLAAVGAALAFPTIAASATGGPVAVATELAYPIGDFLLAALVVGVLALRSWRLDRIWALLTSGFLMLAVADVMYAVQVASGSSSPSPMTNLIYVMAVSLLALAAWCGDAGGERTRLSNWSMLAIPAAFTLIAFGLLLYDHWRRLDPLAFGLAVLTLIAALLRTGLTFRDVRSLVEARQQASTDELTLLPNRRQFARHLRTAIAAAELSGTKLAVLLMDLDNFKELNDTLGHHAGDALLRLIGPRVKTALRGEDVVARLGGDEFAILLDPRPGEDGVGLVAQRIRTALSAPFEVSGLALRITASIGISSYPSNALDGDELIKCADIAMYEAKARRSGYEFYASDRDTNSRERLAVAGEFALALEHDGIEVHYMPLAEAGARRITGVEALVRWRRSDGRMIPPSEFVTAAELAGLSRAMTRAVLTRGLDQLRSWRLAGHDIHLAVNTTVADLLDAEFPAEVAELLDARGLPPDALVLEVTETSVLSDPVRIGAVLTQLGELGVGLSLDDFGTGYSSLAHLKTLPIREVKVDRSFVGRMCSDMTDAAIVHATVDLARSLGIRVVAEGVEDEETWETLNAIGCDLIQGYALSKPLPAAELETRLWTGTGAAEVMQGEGHGAAPPARP